MREQGREKRCVRAHAKEKLRGGDQVKRGNKRLKEEKQ